MSYMRNTVVIIALIAWLFLLSGPLVSFSHAQPPPQQASYATRESDRFGHEQEKRAERELRKAPEKPSKPKVETETPKPGEQAFFVKKITLVGCESYPPEDFQSIIEKYENKDQTLTELNNLAKEVAGEYLKRGVIAAVFLPPQEIKDQAVTMQVVEAKMGMLDVQKSPFFRKKLLRKVLK